MTIQNILYHPHFYCPCSSAHTASSLSLSLSLFLCLLSISDLRQFFVAFSNLTIESQQYYIYTRVSEKEDKKNCHVIMIGIIISYTIKHT